MYNGSMTARHQYRPPARIGEDELHRVVTLTEAARRWYRHRSTLRYAIDAGLVSARQSGRTWLISVSSLIAHYGPPPDSVKAA
jgi:hypothetical protein